MQPKELTLLFTATDRLGYGRMGMKLAEALRKDNVDVYETLADERFPGRDTRSKQTNVVCTISYPSHLRGWYEGQHVAAFTMWETRQLPEAFYESIHEYDTIIVPSQQNVELFSEYHNNVKLCYLGVGPEWKYVERTKQGPYFNFLIGGSGPRKGVDMAVEAFRKVFATYPADGLIPRLIVKAPKPQDVWGDRIEQINGFMSSEDEIALYSSAHCYLQPSRGEGFGLQPLQAIAQGLPTILTNAHGQEAFAHLGYPISADVAKAGFFMLGDAGEWWEPNFDELCERMEWVYNHYDEAATRAATNALIAHEEFSWENTAAQFVTAIGASELSKPYSGNGSWQQPTVKRFKLVTNRDYYAEIAGAQFQWLKGETYWETADVKRILMEGGVLDPTCLELSEPGMSEAEVERYSARHSFCPTCNQKLGSGQMRGEA